MLSAKLKGYMVGYAKGVKSTYLGLLGVHIMDRMIKAD